MAAAERTRGARDIICAPGMVKGTHKNHTAPLTIRVTERFPLSDWAAAVIAAPIKSSV